MNLPNDKKFSQYFGAMEFIQEICKFWRGVLIKFLPALS